MKLSDLKVNPDNPRTISEKDYEALKDDILAIPDFLEANKIVYKDGIVVAGNQRLRALTELEAQGKIKVKDEWFIDMSGKSDKEIKRYLITSNVNRGEWDYDILANEYELEDLDAWGVDLPKGLDDEVVEDEAPPVADAASSQLGEVYQLGRHRLMCGDATKIEDINQLMQEQKADLVFIDPPYNVDYSGLGQNDLGKIKNDAMSDDDFSGFLSDVFTNCSELMKSGASIYVCHPDSVSNAKIAFEVRFAESFKKSSTIIWAKQSAGMGWQDYRVQHEPILYGWKGTSHSFFAGRDKTTIWDISRDAQSSYTHPTQKPVILPSEAIKNSSKVDDIVVDLFGGSGSTLIACEQLDRTCYMCELDNKYVDVIRKRYWKFVNEGNEEGWEKNTGAIQVEVANAVPK